MTSESETGKEKPIYKLTQEERNALAVAYLYSGGTKTQSQISDLLGNLGGQIEGVGNQTTVSKLLKLAKKRKWITWSLQPPPDVDLNQIEGLIFGDLPRLEEELNNLAVKNTKGPADMIEADIHVIECEDMNEFGVYAARHVSELIKKKHVKSCAVGWGRTIESVVRNVPREKNQRKDLTFVPISGEPFRHQTQGVSPTVASQILSKAFGSTNKLSLSGVAARIPKGFQGNSDLIRKFVLQYKNYKEIFGDSKNNKEANNSKINDLDMIITGVGEAKSSKKDPWFIEIKESEELDENGVNELITSSVGNIGGVWRPRKNITSDQEDLIKGINSRWLGIQWKHIVKCARRGKESGSPGVVVVAFDDKKAPVIENVMGRINHLIIGRKLAEKLIRRGRKRST